MKPEELPPAAELMKFIVGKWISKPLYVAAELGLADLLDQGPRSIEDLARNSGAHAPTLYRIMRALASVGIFSETEDRHFELTPMAEYLKTGLMRSMALMFNSVWNDQAWEYLLDSVKTGRTPFEKAHGRSLSQWLATHPEAAQVFNQANAVKAAQTHRAILDVYDFSGLDNLIDVGGGLGALAAEILTAHPGMTGTVFDTPAVIEEARKFIQARGLGDRCRTVAGDFFVNVQAGGDIYILSNILHDWPDEQCRTILANCRRAMKPESGLLVVEMIVPPGNEPSIAKLLDLEMLVITGGRERTEMEYHQLLEASGLEVSRIIPTPEGVCVIEATAI